MREDSTSLRALEEALRTAEEAGATTELLDLHELALPMYEPGRPIEEYGEGVERLVESMRDADAMIWSTAAYHGTLAGVTKNALDFAQFWRETRGRILRTGSWGSSRPPGEAWRPSTR